ncbi:PAS domain S-box protein [Bradyrhizobium jicamae]|uniref:bifunctional diguanylate cyclase/phosphodiesterase n=1 Tax=Bradyrhizobium jicamae TaxID=280332 RepID=UPI001BA8A49A|nr:bifunctional diguanylate cyclase/phosphodiesterase [Bradyrhizobium jicamae]MBR0753013.1 PAS domain S-box protein [Bradyrhizobium jicamae]
MSARNDAVSGVPAEIRALNQTFATVQYTPEGKITGANYQFLRLIGYDLDEIVGQNASRFLSNSHQRSEQFELWDALRRGESRELTGLWIAKAGKERWLHSRYVPLPREDGEVAEVVQIATDVSAQQVREADERGQVAAINETHAVVHFALDGTILDANELFLSSVGYRLEEVRGRHHSMFVDEDHRASEAYGEFWRSLRAGEHHAGEYRRRRKDGSDVWLQATYVPIVDPANRPIKVVKYATDVTEEKIRQADYQWQIAAIHKSSCVVTFDMFGTILDANDQFLEASGYTLEEIRGHHHRMFVEASYAHGGDYAAFWDDLRRGKHRAGQYKRFGKQGHEIWLQATYNPIFDASGRPVKVVKFASVVTDDRRLQAEYQGQIAAIHNAQCVISFELDGTVIDANENFLKVTGYRFSEVRGRHHRMFVEPDQADSEEYRNFWRDLTAGRHRSGEYKRVGKDGREIWLQSTYNPIFDLSGRPIKIVKYATDVTAAKLQQADYRGQIDAINKSQGVVTFALDGTILDVNDNFLATLGYSLDELKGRHHSMLVEKQFAASREYAAFWDTLRRGEYHASMYKRLGKDGRAIWIQASYNPILDLNGRPCRVIKYATDVSANVALAEAFEDAKRQAHHDSATSLPNRVKLSAFMDSCLAAPAGSMAVFYIDLDRFKPINDTFGHHVGDRVLGEVADRMRRVLREDQMVARVGGDEFVIAAPGMPMAGIERFCKRLYDVVTQPIRHDGGEIAIGISVGIAVAPTDGTTPDDLLRAADAALYRSKQNGRGHYSFFATEMNDKILAQRKLAEDMRHSLTAGDFYLEYQPRFDTRARRIRSVEALVRWAHPERGRISPADFIPLAEQNGLIVPLGDWILSTACHSAAAWGGIGVSVNVSPVQFHDTQLVHKVRDSLRSAGLPAHLLELEITEGVLLNDAERATRVLSELKDIGVKLAMDDFGTGYSSLSYLRNFPFDVIKIDRSFISDLGTQANARSIVQAILALGRALGLSVTAEGVETNEQLLVLAADQCNEVQGFLLAKPLSADQIFELLAKMHGHVPAEPKYSVA